MFATEFRSLIHLVARWKTGEQGKEDVAQGQALINGNGSPLTRFINLGSTGVSPALSIAWRCFLPLFTRSR